MALGRFIGTDGEMGECPDWYAHIQAAKYLGVDPERLMQMPLYWKSKAMKAMDAEYRGNKIKEAHDKNKPQRGF